MALPSSDLRVISSVRADLAERRVALLEQQQVGVQDQIDWRDAEIARLRGLVDRQLAELARMKERIDELEAEAAAVAIEELIAAFASAADRASIALDGQQITRFQAELKAILRLGGDGAGVIATNPDPGGGEPYSTVSFELAPIPRPGAAGVTLAGALRMLQGALDRPLPAGARQAAGGVLAEVSGLLAADPQPPTRARLGPLVSGLDLVAERLPATEAAAGRLTAVHAALGDAPTSAEARGFAEALVEVSRSLANA